MSLQLMCDDRIFDKCYMISMARNKLFRKQIFTATSWMNPETPLKIRCLAINKGYTERSFPRCVCGKMVTYAKDTQDAFLSVCSSLCSKRTNKRSKSNCSQLNDSNFLFELRITQKKSFEEIARILQCSVTPIKHACKRLKIPDVKWNESDGLTKAYLRDKTWLEDQHNNQKKKLSVIADEIGSSQATVSRWLSFHGIVANNPNEYDRKFNNVSKEETSLVDFIRSVYCGEIQQSNRTILEGKELDIVLPELKIAIEYNGVYSHCYKPDQTNPNIRKDRRYHLSKTLGCAQKGYQLIHIFSDDWIKRQDIVKSILKARLGVTTHTVFARKCVIGECGVEGKKSFLSENHLQGNDRSTIYLALFHNEQIVAVMTFGTSRYNKHYQYELSRFCVKRDFHIPGAFSKLLTHFEKTYKPTSLVSYCDFSRSNGNVYRNNQFNLTKKNPPSYSYVNLAKSIERMHRSNFTKSKLKGEGTEEDIMYANGYHKIFDCGTLVFSKQYTTKN